MITKLTASQEAQLAEYRDKWLAIGLSCEPCDFEQSKRAAAQAYRSAGLAPPKWYFLFDSPLSAAVGAHMLSQARFGGEDVQNQVRNQVRDQVVSQVMSQVENQVWDQVRNQVWSQVRGQVWSQVESQVWSQVASQVWDQVRNQVWSQVASQVWDQVRNQVWSQVRGQVGDQVASQVRSQGENQVWSQVASQVYGAHDAAWLGYYEFFDKVLGIKAARKLRGLARLARNCGWWTPFSNTAIFQHRHEVVHLVNGILHHDGGPAVRYRDGFAVWALNGVRVTQELAETRSEDLNPHQLLEIENAEIRREFVRKVGIKRVCYALNAKPIDKQGHYELLLLDLGDGRQRPYLKMLNPSIDTWHVEGVHPDCLTVQAALNWRNGLDATKIDDEHGTEWFQQGDVIIRPRGAKTYKSQPSILT